MAKKVKVVLNRSGVRQLLLSSEMEGIVSGLARQALGRLGSGYEQDTYKGRNRVNAMIVAKTYKAKRDNSKNNSLLKALRGG